MPFVTYNAQGRLGNNLFQYLFSRLFSIRFGHTYTENKENTQKWLTVTDENAESIWDHPDVSSSNIYCDGYFQVSSYYLPHRDKLLKLLSESLDHKITIGDQGGSIRLSDYLDQKCDKEWVDGDVVMSLRLDDFYQAPCPTSDIIPPQYYMNILRTLDVKRLFIVSDKLRHWWENEYVSYFKKWNPIFVNGSVLSDTACMRTAPVLIHSNSTLCWFSSFLSDQPKKRYIPTTNFYKGQKLGKISDDDTVDTVHPLKHFEILHIKHKIFSLPYCIPDELVVDANKCEKQREVARMVPGDRSTYIFKNENDYYNDYQEARYAPTTKKGGWDCLRHYEILANGCIPRFDRLEQCPSSSLISFPKQLVMEAMNAPDQYEMYRRKILEHTKAHCTTSATSSYFFDMLPLNKAGIKNVLLVTCDKGVNYTRELLWIGVKRYIQSIGGLAVEYPKIDYLYEDVKDVRNLHGMGFTYTKRLTNDKEDKDVNVQEYITSKKWDLIIFGKTGPDEGIYGTIPNQPLFQLIYQNYTKEQIVFLYGGDEQFDMTKDTHYRQHLLYHSQFGTCFVREFNR